MDKRLTDLREQVGYYVGLAERLEQLAQQQARVGSRAAVIDLLEAAQFIRDTVAAVVP